MDSRAPDETDRPQRGVLAKASGGTVIQFLLSRAVADRIHLKPRMHFYVELERSQMIIRATTLKVGSTATGHGSQVGINVRAAFLWRGVPATAIELAHEFRDCDLLVDLSRLPVAKSQRRSA